MPVHPVIRAVRTCIPVLALALLASCSTSAAGPAPAESPPPAVDPASAPAVGRSPDGPASYEIEVVADFGPLPDGSGNAVVTTVWTVDAFGTRRVVVDTPAGVAARHVMTDQEHWWWLDPAVRETIVDAEWIHFDLGEVDEAGGALPDVVVDARVPLPPPGEILVGQIVAGHEVVAVDVVGPDEAHLTMAGIDRAVVHRRRLLPSGTRLDIPSGAVDVADLPDVLRW